MSHLPTVDRNRGAGNLRSLIRCELDQQRGYKRGLYQLPEVRVDAPAPAYEPVSSTVTRSISATLQA